MPEGSRPNTKHRLHRLDFHLNVESEIGSQGVSFRTRRHISFGLGLKTPAAADDALLGNAQKQTAPLVPFV